MERLDPASSTWPSSSRPRNIHPAPRGSADVAQPRESLVVGGANTIFMSLSSLSFIPAASTPALGGRAFRCRTIVGFANTRDDAQQLDAIFSVISIISSRIHMMESLKQRNVSVLRVQRIAPALEHAPYRLLDGGSLAANRVSGSLLRPLAPEQVDVYFHQSYAIYGYSPPETRTEYGLCASSACARISCSQNAKF